MSDVAGRLADFTSGFQPRCAAATAALYSHYKYRVAS